MASFSTVSSLLLHHRRCLLPPSHQIKAPPPTLGNPNPRILPPPPPPHHHHHRHRRLPWFCRATPSPPVPQPPFSNDSDDGAQVVLSKIRDRVRIFFAVLFWMSLFFWGSAWDGRDSSRKKKGPWFRK